MATLSVEDFLAKARPLNPDYSDDELIEAYHEQYANTQDPPTQTVSPAPLMTLEEFLPKAKALNPDYDDEELAEAWREKYGARGAREKDQGDVGRGFTTAFKQIPQLLGGVEAGAGAVGEKIFGEGGLFTALKEHGLRNYREIEEEIGRESKPSDSVTEAYKMARAGNPGALVDWLQHTLGYGGGQALQMLATAGIGYAGGKLALKTVAETTANKLIAKESARIAATAAGSKLAADAVRKQAISNVAGKIGQLGALGATAVGMEGGEIFGGLVDKATKEGRSLTGAELAKATGATLAAGGLEFVGDKIGLDLVLGKSVAKGLVTSRLGHAAAAGTVGTATEGGTEFTQTLLEEFGKGNDPFSPESITQAIDAAAVGGVAGGAMGTIGGILNRPDDRADLQVTDRTEPERLALPAPPIYGEGPVYTPTGTVEEVIPGKGRLAGLGPGTQPEVFDGEALPPSGPRQLTRSPQPPQPGEMYAGRVYGEGPVVDVSPLPDVSPVTNASTLDEAIAGAVGVVQGATETAKARAAEFAKMTSRARNEAERLIANAPEKRTGADTPILEGPVQTEQPLIAPGQAFTPRAEPEIDPRQALAEERARMVAQERMRPPEPKTPAPQATVLDQQPLKTAQEAGVDKAYPSVEDLHRLAESKGLQWNSNPVFMEFTRMATGKAHLDALSPVERQKFADTLSKIKAPQSPTPTEAPPQVPLTPREEKPYDPVTTIPEATMPRSALPPEKNAEVLLRAEKAKADLEIAGKETGRRKVFQDNMTGPGLEVTSLQSAAPDWYKDLTSGPSPAIRGDRKQSAREKIEEAISKIIKNQGADRGKAVELVKAALLEDQEFHQTEWGRDLQSILDGEWPEWVDKPEGTSTTTSEPQVVPRGTTQVPDEVPAQPTKSSALKAEAEKMKPKPKDALDLIDRLYRDILDDTKVVHTMQREQKDRWATVKRIDQAMKDSLKAGKDYEEAAQGIAAQDLTALSSILEGKAPAKPAPAKADMLKQEAEKMKAKNEEPPTPDFELTAPKVSEKKANSTAKSEQLSIDVPPPTSGERPIIGRETTPEEAPLFSKAAQEPDDIQTSLDESPKETWQMTALEYTQSRLPESMKGRVLTAQKTYEGQHRKEIQGAIDRGETIPPEVLADYPDLQPKVEEPAQPEPSPSPTDILASALRSAADQIEGKPQPATLESHDAFMRRVYEGQVTPEEFKASFQRVWDGKDAIMAELAKLNKEKLVERVGYGARSGDKKDSLVRQAYTSTLADFALGEGISYSLGSKDGYEQAVKKLVDKTTADTISKYAEKVAARRAERKARLEGFANPQTIDDFDTRVRIKGESSLNPEQLARYDELLAQAGRAKRQQAKEQQATVQGVDAGTDLQLIESKHTKTGEKLWVVKLANRVDRAVYDRLNQAAHKLGGRYSSYNKDGAIPGFTFRSKEAADSFMAAGKGETVSAAPIRQAQQAEKQDNAVSRLRDMADRLSEKADASINADRKTNTARRARMASSAENAAYADKAQAETMRNLADAIESGEATHLSGLRTKAQVEMLDVLISRAKADRIRKETGSYAEYEKQKYRPAVKEDAAFVQFPEFLIDPERMASITKDLKDRPGTERVRMRLAKSASQSRDGKGVPVNRADAEEIIDKYPTGRFMQPPWQWVEALATAKRLDAMGITSLPELRAALREFVEYRGKRKEIDKAKQLERNLIGNKGIGTDFFPTPKATAERMVREADIQPGMKVLEPSAGNGNIAEAIRESGVNPDVVEQSSALREILEAKGFTLVGQDFMDVTEGGYDRIVMNPPFSNGQDAEHIQHAYELLKPGGKLVAIAGEGVFFRDDAKSKAFRAWLEEQGGTDEKLPEGTFKDSSLMATTGVNARLVVVEKSETDQGTALYEERQGATHEPTMEQFAQAFREGLPISGTDQQLIDSSQQFPKELMRGLSTKRYVRQLTTELNRAFTLIKKILVQSDSAFQRASFAAMSPDDYYVGVNLLDSNRIVLNPWGALWTGERYIADGHGTPGHEAEYTAGVLVRTIMHELTHQQVETTHKDDLGEAFEDQLDRNRAIVGDERLAMVQRRVMDILTGGPDGTLAALTADLRAQQAFWKEGDGVSDVAGPRSPKPAYAQRRQAASGEGASGRTGPPTDLRSSGERETAALDESPSLRGRGAVNFARRTPTDDISLTFPGMEEPTNEARPTGTINPDHARDQLKASKASLRPYLLGSLGLEQLAQVYGRDHAEVKGYNKATQAMEADFVEMSRASEQIVKAWTKLKIPVADQMAQVMEDARFLNFDPDPTSKQEADSQKKRDLRKRFEALPGDAQSTYRLARDFYTTMAEARFQALKERIERAGGTPENTKKLVDRLQIAYEQVRSKVYFPFTRFGENIVVAKKMEHGVEKDREVHAFESTAEAQQFATMMKMKGWTVKQTVARQYSVDKEGPASKIVRQMHDIIKELDEQPGLPGVSNLTDQLLDSLNQSFLQALPDMSYAKHFIHAKDVKGASKDALRAFAHSALHGAHHISRIRHADRITHALTKLDDRINKTDEGDTIEARQVYNELVQRHNEILNPSTHPVSAWLGQLGFTMSLGGVVATGVTNATQVPLITYPWLGARFGFTKASAALARAYKDFLDPHTLNSDSLFDATKGLEKESERLTKKGDHKAAAKVDEEVKMLKELARRGRIDLTQTMDLAGLSAQDNLSRVARQVGTTRGKVMRMLGFTFHAPEVMNRQVTALAAFRLELAQKGGTYESALQRAEQSIIDTHFIYTSTNRPRYMSGNVLRVLTMFKQYSQNIAYLYGRAASIWLDKNHATAEERDVAKWQLISMLALQFGAAGALGMPFFGASADILMSVVAAFGDDDEKRDWEVSLRQWLDGSATTLAEAFTDDKEKARERGKLIGQVVSHGLSRLTPFDMANRLGQQDLFFRAPQREREGRQAAMDWLTSFSGPVVGYAVNGMLGVSDLAKGVKEGSAGFFMRGVEELTPAVIRNGVKALRYAMEDVRTRDQYKQLELRPDETLGQAFGFAPGRVAEMYESITAVRNKEHRAMNQRKTLLQRFARAVQERDMNSRRKILEDIRAFNSRNRMFGITSDTLNRSIKARRQHEAGMERGIYLPGKRRALLEEGDWADF